MEKSVWVQVPFFTPRKRHTANWQYAVFIIMELLTMYEKILKVRNFPVIDALLRFFNGDFYPLIYAALALICSFTGFELVFFGITAVIVIFTAVFSIDSKPLITPLVLVVYSVSQKHTPQPPYNSDYLYRRYVLITIAVLFTVCVAALVFRMIAYKSWQNIFKNKTITRWGLFIFGGVLLLNGLFSSGYTIETFIFGILFAFSFIFFYIYFYNTLQWQNNTGIFIAKVLCIAAGIIMIQLTEMLIFDGAIQNGIIDKGHLNLGWGLSNNVGGMLAMFMPACFYLAYKQENGLKCVLLYLYGVLLIAGVAFTLSRTSLLVGGFVLLAIMILMSIRGKHVKNVRICNLILIICSVILIILFFDQLGQLFKHYIEKGLDDSSRFDIWKKGWLLFLKNPVFGAGFSVSLYNIENWVFPDMYHNTYIQLLASCGILGAAAYTLHLAQGALLFFKSPSDERFFYFLTAFILTAMSMLDNHIFHVFPTLVYALMFAVAELEYKNKRKELLQNEDFSII